MDNLSLLSRIHDIGKTGIPEEILLKQGNLNEKEMMEKKRHPDIGYRIAKAFTDFHSVAHLILHHHENWDGSGYPQGLKGEEIPVECRIFSIVKAFVFKNGKLDYRKGDEGEEALQDVTRDAGSRFDPQLIQVFADMREDIKLILNQ